MEIQTDYKIHIPTRRQFLVLIPFALFYASAIIFGDLEKARYLGMFRNAGRFLVCIVGSYLVLLILCSVISQKQAIISGFPFCSRLPVKKPRQGKLYIYVLFAAVCLLGYMPYFLMYYPTWLNNDAVWQIEQILGWAAKSNHHPYFHTMIMKCLFMIGYRLSGTYTGGAAFYTFCQIFVMACVFAFFPYWLYKRGTRIIWVVLSLAFYAALPINSLLTICMGKDEFFTASLLFFAWMTTEYDLDTEKNAGGGELDGGWTKSGSIIKWVLCFITGLLVCLLRSNGVFIFAGTAFVLLISKMKKGKTADAASSELIQAKVFPVKTFFCTAAVLVCFFIYHGPILDAMHVEPPDTIEGLTMPTQHILCAYLKGGELTPEEVEMIDRVVPVDEVENYYNPWLFDIVKNFIRTSGNQQVIADNKGEYFKLWLRVGLRNPFQYFVAEVRQTAGYWAYKVKDYEYVYTEYYMVDNPLGITSQRKFFSYNNELAMHDFLMDFQDLYNRVWSLGLNTWLMVFCIAYMTFNRKSSMIFIPFIMMLITLFLAVPIYNIFRYAYGLFAAFPILLSYTFGDGGNAAGDTEVTDEKMV